MNDIRGLGKLLVLIGIILVFAGVIINLGFKLPAFGKLPGDIYIKRNGFSLYFPMTTCLIISILITFLITLINLFK